MIMDSTPTRLGTRLAGILSGISVIVYVALRNQRTFRPARRQHDWPDLRHRRIRIHAFCGVAGRAQTCADMAVRSRASLDARASLAGFAQPSVDFVPRRISLRRRTDARADVAADHHRCERPVRRRLAELRSANHDRRTFHSRRSTTKSDTCEILCVKKLTALWNRCVVQLDWQAALAASRSAPAVLPPCVPLPRVPLRFAPPRR